MSYIQLDTDILTVETTISKSLDILIRLKFDPIWHTLSMTARQLVGDLKVLRQLLHNLTQYDCVTFLKFVESLRSSEKKFGQNVGWLFLESADNLFANARVRVYGEQKTTKKLKIKDVSSGEEKLQFEENPKWKIVKELLEEIRKENESNETGIGIGKTLIAASDDWTCSQLKDYLCEGGQSLLTRIHEKSLLQQTEQTNTTEQQTNKYNWNWKNKQKSSSTDQPSTSQFKTWPSNTRFTNKTQPASKSDDSDSTTTTTTTTQILREDCEDDETHNSTLGPLTDYVYDPMNDNDTDKPDRPIDRDEGDILPAEAYYGFISAPITVIHPLHGCIDPYSLQRTLTQVRPRYVILYDPEIQFVRQLEVYKANNPHVPMRVYFIMFDASVEEQKYLTTLRKEKESFETLIRQKASLVITEGGDSLATDKDFDDGVILDSRKAGSKQQQNNDPIQQKIIVDMREFRSELPSLIHRRGIDIEPVTVEVGDYILTPDICVERKSVSDLIGSLNNGRLYNQALSMIRHYKRAILLIEFSDNKSFSLQCKGPLSKDISYSDVTSRLTLLTIHFPKLRIIWSPNAYATAEIFEELKAGRPQPSAEAALAVTSDDRTHVPISPSDKYSHVHQDLVLKLPGINSRNYMYILNNVKDLKELCTLSEQRLSDILGSSVVAKQIVDFLHKQHNIEPNQPSTSQQQQQQQHSLLGKRKPFFKRNR